MKVITAPYHNYDYSSVFLAGSIEMGKAEQWQDRVIEGLKDTSWTILNPRRPDWDSSWEQSLDEPKFVEQVEWELENISDAFYVLMYFDPVTKSPISLMELGWVGGLDKGNLLVVCPEGYWRKGNVDVFCQRNQIHQFKTLDEAIAHLIKFQHKF
jgi:hypothetical protein